MRHMWIAGLFGLLLTRPALAQDVYRVSDQVTAPTLIVAPPPVDTGAGMLNVQRVSGGLELEVDVMPDGSVGTVALVKSLAPHLDKHAAEAAKRARFTPGTKDGKPVTVRTTLTFSFFPRQPMTFRGADEKDLPGKTALPK